MATMMKGECGHFYDQETSTKCPYCGIGNVDLTKKFKPEMEIDATQQYREDDEKTRMYPGSGGTRTAGTGGTRSASDDPEATVAVWRKKTGIDPIVGWLVCSEGANQGRDYRLRSGYNNIGRDTANQVCIAGDETISKEHAKIFFDPKSASFHVIAGEGRSGIYVNDSAVLQPTLLKPYDILEIGETKLVFVPFCGERFRWDTGA